MAKMHFHFQFAEAVGGGNGLAPIRGRSVRLTVVYFRSTPLEDRILA